MLVAPSGYKRTLCRHLLFHLISAIPRFERRFIVESARDAVRPQIAIAGSRNCRWFRAPATKPAILSRKFNELWINRSSLKSAVNKINGLSDVGSNHTQPTHSCHPLNTHQLSAWKSATAARPLASRTALPAPFASFTDPQGVRQLSGLSRRDHGLGRAI
jgi:hypothetical protein